MRGADRVWVARDRLGEAFLGDAQAAAERPRELAVEPALGGQRVGVVGVDLERTLELVVHLEQADRVGRDAVEQHQAPFVAEDGEMRVGVVVVRGRRPGGRGPGLRRRTLRLTSGSVASSPRCRQTSARRAERASPWASEAEWRRVDDQPDDSAATGNAPHGYGRTKGSRPGDGESQLTTAERRSRRTGKTQGLPTTWRPAWCPWR